MRRGRDALAASAVHRAALYGPFPPPALETLDLSGRAPNPALVRAYARITKAAARANARLGVLPPTWARAIAWAADRVAAGRAPDAAVLDGLQAGAGAPTPHYSKKGVPQLPQAPLGGGRRRHPPPPPDHPAH